MSLFNKSIKLLSSCVVLLFIGFGSLGTVSAQTNKGGISGTVTDPHGAVVAGATVTITNVGTNQSVKIITSPSGSYTSPQLDPVVYRLTVEFTGFKKTLLENIKVDTASTTNADVMLELGRANEEVTITAESPLINTEEGTAGTTISERQIQDLPISDRFVLGLALTLPNVSGATTNEEVGVFTGAISPGTGLNINGGRPSEGTFLADGVSNSGAGAARAMVNFSPETVQEFKVSTSNFSAEYGNTGGGVVNVTTKSGTNLFHGTASIFNRNPWSNAKTFDYSTALRPQPFLRMTNGALTFGGPVFLPAFGEGGPLFYDGRNKTFFFFAYERKYRSDKLIAFSLVPTAAQLNGDFTDLVSANGILVPKSAADRFGIASTPVYIYQQAQLVNGQLRPLALPPGGHYCQFGVVTCNSSVTPTAALNVIPAAYLDAVSQRILKQGMPPAGEYFLNGSTIQNLVYYRAVTARSQPLSIRIDHKINNSDNLNFRITSTPNYGERPRGYFGDSTVNQFPTDYSTTRQILVGETHIFTPTLVNDLKLSYVQGYFSTTNSPTWQTKNWSTELGLPSLTQGGVPQFNFSTGGAFTIGQNSTAAIADRIDENFNISDVVTWNKGSMSWKFGTDLRHMRLKVLTYAEASDPSYRFQSTLTNNGGSGATGGWDTATFLLGTPNSVTLRNAVLPYYYRWNSGSVFAQNDWKISPNLTLNLGVRYSLELPRTEKYDNQAIFRNDLARTVAMPTSLQTTTGAVFTLNAALQALLPTSTLIPTLAFAGRGGRSRYLYPIDWNNIQPRFGFAWRPTLFGLNGNGMRALVIRGGYGGATGTLFGNDRNAAPDFAAPATGTFGNSTGPGGSSGAVDPTYWMRLSSNVPNLIPTPLITIPADGLITGNSIFYKGSAFEVSQDFKIPYSHSWSVALQYEVARNMSVEVGYQGNKATNLFLPAINKSLIPTNTALTFVGTNTSETTSIRDPLNRPSNPFVANSTPINVPLYSLFTPYAGFESLINKYDPKGSSIRHAGYVTFESRFSRGLSMRASYTFQKNYTNASNTGIDQGGGSRIYTQLGVGGTLKQEWSEASWDQPHVFATTFSYDLPIGKKEPFLSNMPGFLDAILGGWKLSGIGRVTSGELFQVGLFDGNFVTTNNNQFTPGVSGGSVQAVRPNIVPGVPLKNPLYDKNCKFLTGCQPYANPAAFVRPPKGQIGNAPAVLSFSSPTKQFYDMSIMKNVYFGKDRKMYVQLKVDAINVFNIPTPKINGNNSSNGTWLMGQPNESDITAAQYTSWANAWNAAHPSDPVSTATTGTGTLFSQVVGYTSAARVNGVLPNDYWSVPLPQNVWGLTLGQVDLRTLGGYKTYRQRALDGNASTYNTQWGTLLSFTGGDTGSARYFQFSAKFSF
jgi:hypothetical protein